MSELEMSEQRQGTGDQMRISRLNLILMAVLLVQFLAIVALYWPETADTVTDAPLLDELTQGEIQGFALADNAGNSIRLERAGDGWMLPDFDGYPVASDKVEEMLVKLLAIDGDRQVTRTADSHKRLEVADDAFAKRITLTTSDGEQTIFIGSSAGSGANHVRVAGEEPVYLTSEIAAWELNAPALNWVEPLYFSTTARNIVGIELRNANGELIFERDDPGGEWRMAGLVESEQLDVTRIDSLLNQLAAIRMAAPVGKAELPEFGLSEPQATVVVTERNGDGEDQVHTLVVGTPQDETKNVYFKASDSPFVVTIPSYTGEVFTDKERADYVAEPADDADTADEFPSLSSE